MTQKKWLLYIIAILPFFLTAQTSDDANYTIDWGNQTIEPPGTMLSRIVSWNNDGFYALRIKAAVQNNPDGPSRVYLERYNKSMDMVKSNEFDLKFKKKRRQFEDILMIGGQLYLFTSFNNEAKKKNYLFAQAVSLKGLRPAKDLTYMGEIDTKNKFKEGSFNFHISRDSSKVLIYNQLPYQKKSPERLAVRIYNDRLQELWSRKIKLPYDDDKFELEDYRVDNDGNLYLLGVLYQDGSKKRRRGAPNYKYVILVYNSEGGKATKYKIDLNERFITDLTFRIADNGELICSGFYSEKGTYSMKGTYFFRIDQKEKRIFNQNVKELDFEFRTEFISERKKGKLRKSEKKGDVKKAAELESYSLDKLILRNDGGALLIAEQYYVDERVNDRYYGSVYADPFYRNRGYNDYEYYYYYNDIIIVNIKPDGEVEWTARIPKRQITRNDGGYFSSYAMSIVRDKIYFIYNDNAKNYSAKNKENSFYNWEGDHSIIAMSEVHQDGSVYTFPLLHDKHTSVVTRPKVCRQIGKKVMAIYGESGRKSQFGKLKF